MAQPRSSFCPQQRSLLTRRCYLSAIALNNIGVRHMERQSYAHAVETLKDAIALVKRVLIPARKGDHCDNDCGESLVQLAVQRLTQTKAGATPVMPLEVFTRASDGSLTSDKSQEDFSTVALQFPPLSSVAFPIRLEGASCMYDPEDLAPAQDLYLQAAMMLHNLGIAMLCLGKADKSEAHKMRSSALRLFRKSYSILVKHYTFLEDQKETSPNIRALGLPFLLMVVLDTYIPTLHESSQHENSKELYEYLLQLRSYAASSLNNFSTPRAAGAA
jgi:tetratricopeptide (TPR) repeat protein